MKSAFFATSIFIATAMAAPVAVADPHWGSISSWWNSLFGGNQNSSNTNNNNSNGNNNNNANKVINEIYIIPGGALISGNATSVPASSVPFTGSVQNNRLYANTPALGNVGSVAVGSNGQLHVVPNGAPSATSSNWTAQNGSVKPDGNDIISCPDASGHTYLFVGVTCPGASPIAIQA